MGHVIIVLMVLYTNQELILTRVRDHRSDLGSLDQYLEVSQIGIPDSDMGLDDLP